MNMSEDLEGLIERACKLEEGLNEEINKSESLCKWCSHHGWLCKIAETQTSLEKRKKLIALRDSLKDLRAILIHMQRMKAWHMINREAALKQVEERRMILMEKVSEFEGMPLSVIQELNSSFGHGRSASDWRLKMKYQKSNNRFLRWCTEFMCNRDRWHTVIGAAAKVIAVSIGVSCIVRFCGRGKQICSSGMRRVPNSHIDVFKGRG